MPTKRVWSDPATRAAAQREWHRNHPGKHAEYARTDRAKLRKRIFLEYGNRCTCCGESRLEFLGIDHINGKGHKPRNKYGDRITGYKFYEWLRSQGYPKDNYRILCHNCNQALGYFGYCPHQNEEAVMRAVWHPELKEVAQISA